MKKKGWRDEGADYLSTYDGRKATTYTFSLLKFNKWKLSKKGFFYSTNHDFGLKFKAFFTFYLDLKFLQLPRKWNGNESVFVFFSASYAYPGIQDIYGF